MRKFKKTLSLIMAVCMLFVCTTTAFAAEAEAENTRQEDAADPSNVNVIVKDIAELSDDGGPVSLEEAEAMLDAEVSPRSVYLLQESGTSTGNVSFSYAVPATLPVTIIVYLGFTDGSTGTVSLKAGNYSNSRYTANNASNVITSGVVTAAGIYEISVKNIPAGKTLVYVFKVYAT